MSRKITNVIRFSCFVSSVIDFFVMQAMLWDLNDGKHLYTLDHADTINVLCFSPNRCVFACSLLFFRSCSAVYRWHFALNVYEKILTSFSTFVRIRTDPHSIWSAESD